MYWLPVRRCMHSLILQEQLVQREHHKDSIRRRKRERQMQEMAGLRPSTGQAAAGSNGIAGLDQRLAAGEAAEAEGEEDEPITKGHTSTYCCLDYPRILDSVRWRLAVVKKNLNKEIRGGGQVQQYKCTHPDCGKEYSSMDIFDLLPLPGDTGSRSKELACGVCGSPIEMILDEGGKTLGTMEDKKQQIKKARALLEGFDSALAPLTNLLALVEPIQPPDFNTYYNWLQAQVAQNKHLQAISAATNGASTSRPSAAPAYNSNMQVVLSFGDTKSSSSNTAGSIRVAPGAVSAGAAPGRGAAAAAGVSQGQGSTRIAALPDSAMQLGAGLAGVTGAGAGAAGKGDSKPLPPWLASKVRQHQQSQQQPAIPQPGLPGAAAAIGAAPAPGAAKPEQDAKGMEWKYATGLKDEPDVKFDADSKQAVFAGPAALETQGSDEWEAVPGETAAGEPRPSSVAATDATAEEEDWEDV
eukprot:GHRR01017097.1.p1 GENE.GHRR01017097.1~~GHRR01017097.1.p1  ORF type:complete len:469 (+),score=207.91 GHRR01017097.1:1151-2557(+)